MSFIITLEKVIRKFIWIYERSDSVKAILWRKYFIGGPTIFDPKLHCCVIMAELQTDRQIEETRWPEYKQQCCGHTKMSKYVERKQLIQEIVLAQLDIHLQCNEIWFKSVTLYKNIWKHNKDLKRKSKMLKLPEENKCPSKCSYFEELS